jgi:hypothetical protein
MDFYRSGKKSNTSLVNQTGDAAEQLQREAVYTARAELQERVQCVLCRNMYVPESEINKRSCFFHPLPERWCRIQHCYVYGCCKMKQPADAHPDRAPRYTACVRTDHSNCIPSGQRTPTDVSVPVGFSRAIDVQYGRTAYKDIYGVWKLIIPPVDLSFPN